MAMEAWPSISETTFTLTPSLKSSVAQVCLRSWKRKSSRTHDLTPLEHRRLLPTEEPDDPQTLS